MYVLTHLASAPNPGGASLGANASLLLLAALVIGTVLSVFVIFASTHRRAQQAHASFSEDVDVGLRLLRARVADLRTAGPSGDAATALADATDRLAAAESLRSDADSPVILRAVRRTLLEGLTAVRHGDVLLGRDPGPAVPPPTPARMVEQTVRVVVGPETYVAQPAYVPGFAHHYSGGRFGADEVPGGWYSTPFWEGLLDPDGPSAQATGSGTP